MEPIGFVAEAVNRISSGMDGTGVRGNLPANPTPLFVCQVCEITTFDDGGLLLTGMQTKAASNSLQNYVPGKFGQT